MIYLPYLKFYVSYYSPIRQKNNANNKINQLTDSDFNLKFYFINFINYSQTTTLVFLIHALVKLLKHVANKNETFAIFPNLSKLQGNSYNLDN